MDIKSLETKLGRDKGYSRASGFTEKERAMGFVCPRADAYGGREGMIPPGVAAVRGLVPRGMRHIKSADVARSANEARDNGVSDIDQYREYYGRVAAKTAAAPVQGYAAPAPVAPVAQPPPPPEEPVLRDPDDPGMFSRDVAGPDAADTLDGFYEDLGKAPAGTAGRGPEASEKAGSAEQGAGLGAVPSRPVAHGEPAGDAAIELAAVYAERERLQLTVAGLTSEIGRLRQQLGGYAARDQHYAAIERELANRPAESPAETVRVALSAREERLKVGGRGWECNVMGSLHRGRTGSSLVLTVTDPGYGSELLAEVRPGDVVVLSAAERTYCAYSGRCAKIYGDAGSPDFITMLWLDAHEDQ